jgi:hypothetical protein
MEQDCGFSMEFLYVVNLDKQVTSQKDNGADFLAYLSKNHIQMMIEFSTGNFQQNLEKTITNFKPLILYVHHPNSNSYTP